MLIETDLCNNNGAAEAMSGGVDALEDCPKGVGSLSGCESYQIINDAYYRRTDLSRKECWVRKLTELGLGQLKQIYVEHPRTGPVPPGRTIA